MRLLGTFSVAMATLLVAGAASALSGPKVTVTYSMEQRDGGRFVQQIAGTALGAGDQIFVVSETDDCKGSDPYSGGELCGSNTASNQAEVWAAGETLPLDPLTAATPGPVAGSTGDSPQLMKIEYTSDGSGTIIAGPVELVDMRTAHVFSVYAAGGLSTTMSDLKAELVIGATGTYDGASTITWSGPWATRGTGSTQCGGDATICTLGAPPGGWPRIEPNVTDFISNGNPGACPDRPGLTIPAIPTFVVGGGQSTVDSSNGTPDVFTDDLLVNCDTQAITYQSLYGVETARQFTAAGAVPVLGPMAQLLLGGVIASTGGLVALRRMRKS